MLIVVLVVIALLVVWLIALYNGLVQKRNRVDNSWAQIDVQLKRRCDLIPNLVETVKGYASHEREDVRSGDASAGGGCGRPDTGSRQQRKRRTCSARRSVSCSQSPRPTQN